MPLNKEAIVVLNGSGEELKHVLTQIVEKFPLSAKTISGMSKWLNFNRSNCQRILNAITNAKKGTDVLCLLPGIAGLEEFVNQIKKQNIDGSLIEDINKAINSFNTKIYTYSRSHAELKRFLTEAAKITPEENETLSATQCRKQHFVASKQLLQSSVKSLYTCYVLTENNLNTEHLLEVALISKQGVSLKEQGPPFVQFYTHPQPKNFEGPESITQDSVIESSQFRVGIVDQFSDAGLRDAYSHYSESNAGIVFNSLGTNAPFDATFLFSNPDELANPLVHESRCSSTNITIKSPTEKLVMMVFLEKKLDMRSTVNVGCFSGNQRIDESQFKASDLWIEQVSEFPELNVIHPTSPRSKFIGELAVGEINDFVFNFAQLNKQDFVCYMVEVDYPVWASTYRIYFEHV